MLSSTLHALEVDSYSTAENQRFANNGSFLGNAYDFSGVGRSSAGRWVTMISSNVFVSALHARPTNGHTVSFYPDNNPLSVPVTRTVMGGQGVGGDLYIGYLNAPVSPNIAIYNFESTPHTDSSFNSSPLLGAQVIMTGKSSNSTYSSPADMVIGFNRLDRHRTFSAGGNSGKTLYTLKDSSSDSPFVVKEAQIDPASGDSGAPLFIDEGGNLKVLGTAWGGDAITIWGVTRPASTFSYTGNHSREMDSYIAQHSPAPEPSSALLLLSSSLFLFRRQR